MPDNDLIRRLQYLWQEASTRVATIDMVTENFTKGYQQKEVQELILSAVWSAMTPDYFAAFLVASLGKNHPFLCLGSDTLREIASECVWKEIKRRNLVINGSYSISTRTSYRAKELSLLT